MKFKELKNLLVVESFVQVVKLSIYPGYNAELRKNDNIKKMKSGTRMILLKNGDTYSLEPLDENRKPSLKYMAIHNDILHVLKQLKIFEGIFSPSHQYANYDNYNELLALIWRYDRIYFGESYFDTTVKEIKEMSSEPGKLKIMLDNFKKKNPGVEIVFEQKG